MNYTRLLIAAVAAFVVDTLYGVLVWGMALSGEFGRYPDIYRPAADQTGYLPLMLTGTLVGLVFATWFYAKGYEGGSGLTEGLRFGVLMGLFLGAYNSAVNYGIMRIGKKMALTYAGGWVGEWILVGIVIGLVYKPAAGAVRRAAGV